MRRLLTLIIAAIAIAASAAAQQPFTAVVKAEGTLAEVIGDQIEQIEWSRAPSTPPTSPR